MGEANSTPASGGKIQARRYLQGVVTVRGWEIPQARAYIADGDRLIAVTDVTITEVAHSAMLLSQGHERAAQMLGEVLSEDDECGLSG